MLQDSAQVPSILRCLPGGQFFSCFLPFTIGPPEQCEQRKHRGMLCTGEKAIGSKENRYRMSGDLRQRGKLKFTGGRTCGYV